MRVVVDPKVLVSAAITSGVSAQAIDLWLTDRPFEDVTCPTLVGELRDVLLRDKFRRWISYLRMIMRALRGIDAAEGVTKRHNPWHRAGVPAAAGAHNRMR